MIWWKSQSGRECSPSNVCQDHEQNLMPLQTMLRETIKDSEDHNTNLKL